MFLKVMMLIRHGTLAVLDIVAPMKELRIKQRSAKWIKTEPLDLIR